MQLSYDVLKTNHSATMDTIESILGAQPEMTFFRLSMQQQADLIACFIMDEGVVEFDSVRFVSALCTAIATPTKEHGQLLQRAAIKEAKVKYSEILNAMFDAARDQRKRSILPWRKRSPVIDNPFGKDAA